MLRKTTASVCGFAFVALIAPALAQQSDTSGGAGDARQDAIQKAGQIGIADVRALEGAFVLEGTSPSATPLLLIVGPTGDLLAIAAPLLAPGPAAAQAGADAGQSGTGTEPQAGEPAQSGYMATQASPATPNMWDPAAVENAIRRLELGARAVAGEVPAQ